MSTERTRSEDGVALIAALLAVVVLTGLAIVFLSITVSENRATGAERRRETAIHVAEAATDDVIFNVNKSLTYVTTYDGSLCTGDPTSCSTRHIYLQHGTDTYTDEKTWARAVADDLSQTSLTRTGFGEAVGIRPVETTSSTAPMDVVFGVGYIPDRDTVRAGAGKVRVVKLQIQPGVFSPAQAFLVNGDMTIGGGAQTDGITGNVHANGNVFRAGTSGDCSGSSGFCIRGRLSMTGTLRAEPAPDGAELSDSQQTTMDQNNVCPVGLSVPCAAEHIEEGAIRKQVPQFTASYWYKPSQQLNRFTAGGTVDARWWILCPDGEVKQPAGDSIHPKTICGDDVTYPVYWRPALSGNFHGWTFNANCPDTDLSGACWVGDKIVSGAYFVYNSNALTNGGRGAVSVLVSCAGTGHNDAALLTDRTLNPCGGVDGGLNGNYKMAGQPDLVPAIPGLHFVADRDIIVNGQSDTEIDGLIMAREQVRTEGQGDLAGSIVADDCHERDAAGACTAGKRHSTASPVEFNSAKGSFTVSYNERIRLALPGITRIVAWNEL